MSRYPVGPYHVHRAPEVPSPIPLPERLTDLICETTTRSVVVLSLQTGEIFSHVLSGRHTSESPDNCSSFHFVSHGVGVPKRSWPFSTRITIA